MISQTSEAPQQASRGQKENLTQHTPRREEEEKEEEEREGGVTNTLHLEAVERERRGREGGSGDVMISSVLARATGRHSGGGANLTRRSSRRWERGGRGAEREAVQEEECDM